MTFKCKSCGNRKIMGKCIKCSITTKEDKTKMAYEEVNPSIWTYENDGDFVEGHFISIQKDVGENKSNLYTLRKEDGNLISVWGSAILDSRMSAIQVNDMVKITYKGLGEKKGGKNAPKIFKVEVDPDKKLIG